MLTTHTHTKNHAPPPGTVFVFNMNVYLPVYVPHACLMSKAVRRGIRSPGTGVTGSRELLCGLWKLYSCPLQERYVLSTSKSSLQSPNYFNFETGSLYVVLNGQELSL